MEKIELVKQELAIEHPTVPVAVVEWGSKPISPRASDYKSDLQKDKSFDVAIGQYFSSFKAMFVFV